jgi:sortase A
MSKQPSSKSHPVTLLVMAAGVILLLAGALSLLPSISAASEVALEGTPVDFGEEVVPLRPTVTPPPFSSQVTPEPALLPDSSTTKSSASGIPMRRPTPVAPTGSIPSRIVIPSIKLDAPVETVGWHIVDGVSQWDVPNKFAAGWLITSATLGQAGNTAITGHHNVAGEVFRNLVKLQPGDRITLYAQDQPFAYEVKSRRILPERGQPEKVRLENARWMQPTTDERITLITCWPYTSNTHRLIIVAKPVPPEKFNKPIEP